MAVPVGALAGWTRDMVLEECRRAYNAYSRDLDRAYTDYYRKHQDERGKHSRQAADLARALPPGYDHLADLGGRAHVHHLSGRSSQTLALALLGVGAIHDATLQWLYATLGNL